MGSADPISLFLCGDVMPGRGIDQILEHPGAPELREDYIKNARDYVALAEDVSGPVPLPVRPAHVWGEALEILDEAAPHARIVNLEAAITRSDRFWPDKAIHYRMHPRNVSILRAAGVDVCMLANNHLLDFDREGLEETLDTLDDAGIARCGAGRDLGVAEAPARLPLPGGRMLHVFGVGDASSGIPGAWAAGPGRSGIALLPDLSLRSADDLLARIREAHAPGAISVVSIHWGSNWGHEIPPEQIAFARRLVAGGVALVHGHSSHHPRALELYRGRLILYGCGDFIDDYEGIGGYESYRSDLRLMFLPTLADDGRLLRLRLVVLQSRRLSLHRASLADIRWMATLLDAVSRPFGLRILSGAAGELEAIPTSS